MYFSFYNYMSLNTIQMPPNLSQFLWSALSFLCASKRKFRSHNGRWQDPKEKKEKKLLLVPYSLRIYIFILSYVHLCLHNFLWSPSIPPWKLKFQKKKKSFPSSFTFFNYFRDWKSVWNPTGSCNQKEQDSKY